MITPEDAMLFDLITYSYRTFALINDFTNALLSEVEHGTVGPASEFYFPWCEKRLAGKHEVPLNKGTVWMISSAVIVSSKERWLSFLPNTPISLIDSEWGLTECRLDYPSNPDPSIKDIVWKIRNSLSHTDFTVKVGKEGTPWNVLLKETTFTFRDSIGKTPFELEISLSDLIKLNA